MYRAHSATREGFSLLPPQASGTLSPCFKSSPSLPYGGPDVSNDLPLASSTQSWWAHSDCRRVWSLQRGSQGPRTEPSYAGSPVGSPRTCVRPTARSRLFGPWQNPWRGWNWMASLEPQWVEQTNRGTTTHNEWAWKTGREQVTHYYDGQRWACVFYDTLTHTHLVYSHLPDNHQWRKLTDKLSR